SRQTLCVFCTNAACPPMAAMNCSLPSMTLSLIWTPTTLTPDKSTLRMCASTIDVSAKMALSKRQFSKVVSLTTQRRVVSPAPKMTSWNVQSMALRVSVMPLSCDIRARSTAQEPEVVGVEGGELVQNERPTHFDAAGAAAQDLRRKRALAGRTPK